MTVSRVIKQPTNSKQSRSDMVLDVSLPEGTDPAVAASLKPEIERLVELFLLPEQPRVIEQADRIAELLSKKIEPNLGLVRERLERLKTIRRILEEDEWLTAEQLNMLQPNPPAQKSHPASDWKRRGRIFGVSYGGRELFARYQFDEAYQPMPVIRDVLKTFGEVADPWKIAAWFHFPNGWITKPGDTGPQPAAPKDALDQRDVLLGALVKRKGSYVA
jgi:hypothetical protein